MSKALQVKIKVSVLLPALKKSLAERAKRFANNDKLQAEYEKAQEAYNAQLLKLVKAGKGKVTEAEKTHYYRHNSSDKTVAIRATFEFPKSIIGDEPASPDLYKEWSWRNDREALEQAIRVLEMTDQEYVSASTLKSVAEYL
jgi:hypothetical protein